MESALDQARRALIVFFSCAGNTQKAAETLSALTGTALYEIIPEQYTADDFNYNAPNSRANNVGDIEGNPTLQKAYDMGKAV